MSDVWNLGFSGPVIFISAATSNLLSPCSNFVCIAEHSASENASPSVILGVIRVERGDDRTERGVPIESA